MGHVALRKDPREEVSLAINGNSNWLFAVLGMGVGGGGWR